jgi:predicted AlkP superfamily pyrophosphatase or phosphodiesterase
MRRILLVAGLLGLLCLCGIAQTPADTVQVVTPDRTNDPAQEQKPYVILISADGFRHDLAEKYHANILQMLASTGIRAEAMKPAYPSVTFPNHYTLATGLYPSHHGLVDNTFFDAALGLGYTIGNRKAVGDPRFYGGTPIWVLAEQQKMLSASFFWVGTEAPVDGISPTYWYHFNNKIPLETRLKAVHDWLVLPEAQRPHLILFYISDVDHAEHLFGPDSKETEEAVQTVDGCIAKMVQLVDSLKLPVNYVFVSDHGMAAVDTLHPVTPPAIDTTKFRVAFGGTMIHLYARDHSAVESTYEALKKSADGYDVYLPDQTPARWHYTSEDDRYHRIGDILLVAHHPRVFVDRGRILKGEHGYDNALPDMGATFYAWGPAFKPGTKISEFENVNVYPLVAHLLGLTISEPVDGSFKMWKAALTENH